ncbi:MAG: hypothetical protein RUMPE_00078 [Eubacteriales bacterium SKADARSKE-1]|nr:hypothetical protein [Eubacteriales bacterium SKADARSKE-1]
MIKKEKEMNNSIDGVMEISDDAAGFVAGGVVKEDSKKMFFEVFNTTGMGAIKSKVTWGGDTGLTKEQALDKANQLDKFDYSKL